MNESTNVTNRVNGTTIYAVPDMGVMRTFAPGETKKNIPVKELEALSNQTNGKQFIYDNLLIHDAEILRYIINGEEAPEYWLTEEKIPEWMNACSLDEFKDALDFAPDGIKGLIKKYAVEIPLNDFAKRQAMNEQLGYDVTKALELIAPDEPTKDEKKAATPVAAPIGGRRTSAVSIQKPVEEPAPEKKTVTINKPE